MSRAFTSFPHPAVVGSHHLTRQARAWAETRPEAFSETTGNPDTRCGNPVRSVVVGGACETTDAHRVLGPPR